MMAMCTVRKKCFQNKMLLSPNKQLPLRSTRAIMSGGYGWLGICGLSEGV